MGCTLGVHLLGDLEGVGVSQIGVGGRDRQDEAALLADELQQHVSDLVLNVHGLVTHRHLRHAREVDQGQVQHCRGERGREGGRERRDDVTERGRNGERGRKRKGESGSRYRERKRGRKGAKKAGEKGGRRERREWITLLME